MRQLGLLAVGALVLLSTAGCSADSAFGRLGMPYPATEQGQDVILPFWQNSWIAAWIVGGFTWALMFWAMFYFRRRRGDQGLPTQLRYHMPLEALYTFVPVIVIAAMFVFTARDSTDITRVSNDQTHTVGVVGWKWNWTFNYQTEDAYDIGMPDDPATLWLPVNEKVKFELTSPDVIHSFWVPAFLYKLDVIPGRLNQFEVTPNQLGTYAGKCAELCGVDHSRMLFNVKVVTRAEYDAHIADLKANGQGGQLDAGRAITTGVEK